MAIRTFIEQDFDKIKLFYGDLVDGHLFAMWVFSHLHYQGDLAESTLNTIHQQTLVLLNEQAKKRRTGDKKLDGFYFEEDTNQLYLYQCVFPRNASTVEVPDKACEVAEALQILHNDLTSSEAIEGARGEAVSALRAVIEGKGRIILRAVAGSKWGAKTESRIKEVIPNELKKLVEIEVWDLDRLRQAISDQTEDLKGKVVDIAIFGDGKIPCLEHPKPQKPVAGMGNAIVTLVSALSMATIAKQFGQKLFEKNVRLYLGKGRVNKDIQGTLSEEPRRRSFWYGHNGITILCDTYEVKTQGKATVLAIKNPQIVNGCQTATTLAGVFGDPAKQKGVDDFALLARVIELTGNPKERSDAAELVAYRTNSQSAINEADLRANDVQQILFQELLENYKNPWFYERKRGEWNAIPNPHKYKSKGEAPRLIGRDLYQQAWRSYMGSPSQAITKKNAVWERGHGSGTSDLYDQVFDKARRPIDIILAVTLFEWFTKVFTVSHDDQSLCFSIHEGLADSATKIRGAKMLMVSHSVALFGSLIRKHHKDLKNLPEADAQKIVNSLQRGKYVESTWTTPKSWKVLQDFVEKLMEVWSIYIEKLNDEETLYASLKRPQEEALHELEKSLNRLSKNTSSLIKPN